MPEAVFLNYNPPIEGARNSVFYQNAETDASADSIKLIVGSAVPLRRQTEIVAGLKLLTSYLRDSRVLEPRTSALCAAVNIDTLRTPNIRVGGNLAAVSFATTDLALAMGVNAAAKQHVMPLDTAWDVLIDYLIERFKDQAA